MKIRPIKTEQAHEAALRAIEKLWSAKPGTAEADRLEVLAALVHDYEERHHPIEPPDAIEAIKFRLEQGKLTRSDLNDLFGRSRTSEILNRKRKLSLGQIRKLYHLGIPAEVLISGTEVKRRRKGA